MSDAKPLENKIEAVAKIVDTAAALSTPTTAPVAVAKVGWWAARSRKRLALLAGGTAIVLAGGGYGYKYFTAQPGTANAQTTPPAVAEAKPEASPPARSNLLVDDIPDIKPPALKPPSPANDIDLPPVKAPAPSKPDTLPPPPPIIDIELPPIKPPMTEKNDKDIPTLVIPPSTKVDKKDKKSDTIDLDLIKAPDPLPTAVKDKTEKKEESPVIRIGGSDSNPPKKEEPPTIPDIDIKIPAPPTPSTEKKDPPAIPDIDIKIPPTPMTGPAPKTVDVPPPPIVDVPPTIKMPMIPDVPPSPPIRVDLPPPPLIDKTKKDMYDEDWHTQREGDTYTLISKEYYKTADYAQALEAYNKDRRKSGERIVRVPPTWVLEEQFPNLTGPKPEKTDTPEPKTPGGVKFEPTTPTPGGGRPAPPPAGTAVNDEYKVKAEAGETIREISRKVYGSPESWKKLWEMNPNLDPTQPIPNGTTLRLGR